MLCDYGCGQIAQYRLQSNKWCCEKTYQSCLAIKSKNIKGCKEAYQSGKKGYTYNQNSAWNKGKTKDTDVRVKAYAEKASKTLKGRPGRPHSSESLEKIRSSMKKAHAEGRAHNIGHSRWNNEPSWPEKWFMKVIENEFKDRDYKREHPFSKYSLDFVWLHKKKVIEIDGEQHDRFPEQKARDIAKDALLVQHGYEVLRLRWKDICENTKEYVQQMKEFIDI